MRSRSILCGGVLLATACADSPVETPREMQEPEDMAAAVATSSCTKSWASGIGGLWADPSRWSPAGAPGPSDDVCISAAGTYDILATQAIDVHSLLIGGDGAAVTFDFDPPLVDIGINATVGLVVLPGSELNVLSRGLVPLTGGLLMNMGTIDIENVCACGGDVAILTYDYINNLARMTLDAPMTVNTPVWINAVDGVIVTSGQGAIELPSASDVVRNWGQILGSTEIRVHNFEWLGGTLGEMAPATGVVRVTGGTVDLSFPVVTEASGRLEAETNGDLQVNGWVPALAQLDIRALKDDTVRIVGAYGLAPFLNEGRLSIAVNGQIVAEFDRLFNEGTLDIDGTGALELAGNELVNDGVFDNWGSYLTFSLAGGTFRNRGRITGSVKPTSMIMAPGTFFESGGGSMDSTVTIVLDSATLRGTGTMNDVRALGATVTPGDQASGILSVRSLTLDATSTLLITATRYSNGILDVRRAVTFGGRLRLRRIGASVGYGTCGDVMTAIRHRRVTPAGAFASYAGFGGGANVNWRVGALPDSLLLAGYDTTQSITVLRRDTIASEGAFQASVMVCLGATAPAADVVLTVTPVTGQLVAPPAETFSTTDWAIPHTIRVAALDDAVIEPPQEDTLTYATASADPSYDTNLPDRTPVQVFDDDGVTDLEIVLQNAPDTVTVGTVFEVVYRVTNLGPDPSTGSAVVAAGTGAGGLTFQQGFGATCAEDSTWGIVCQAAPLAAGAQRLIVLVFQAATPGDVSLLSQLYGHQRETIGSNNRVVTPIVVN